MYFTWLISICFKVSVKNISQPIKSLPLTFLLENNYNASVAPRSFVDVLKNENPGKRCQETYCFLTCELHMPSELLYKKLIH